MHKINLQRYTFKNQTTGQAIHVTATSPEAARQMATLQANIKK